jgi:hypothetical protein
MRAHFNIYASRAFQWYKERHKTLRFDPCNRSLKFRESTGTPSPKVGIALGVWGFTPSYSLTFSNTLGSMWCDSQASFCLNSRASSWLNSRTSFWFNSRASSWPATLQPLCLGREPKARVATIMLLNEVVKHFLFKPNFDIGRFCDSFYIFQYSYYSINSTFHN